MDRKLNLYCSGQGTRAVLLDAGGSDWSVIWALVQPVVSTQARVCSYDRAGLGYSDPAKGPRSPIAIVDDLHALIHRAELNTPLVLVGHSLGGFNVKLYAALYPEDVAGLVLVDPAEERAAERSRAFLRNRYGPALAARIELSDQPWIDKLIDHYRECASAARVADLASGSTIYRSCTDPVRPKLGPTIAAERARLQGRYSYQQAQASEIANSVYGPPTPDVAYAALFQPGMLGNRPLIVLTHGIHDSEDRFEAASYQADLFLHRQTARLSTRGAHRIVPGSHHNIEIDAPEAITDAIRNILTAIEQQKSEKEVVE
ncbi:alpha/beta hydrolase [Sphingomonas sp.]|uniref:alpha/beta fold hydrolase n=1 Tax=Sphingomonas sp. TaxID=28214 RepID=UPI0025E688EA|nr:alpha/beta hydrolase [Sphingomonas sp.]